MDNLGLTLEIKEKKIKIKDNNIDINNNQIWTHEKITIFIENKNKKETVVYNLDQPIKNITNLFIRRFRT